MKDFKQLLQPVSAYATIKPDGWPQKPAPRVSQVGQIFAACLARGE